jgi:hypothetical protein
VVEYIGMSAETLEKPKEMVETTKRVVKYAFLEIRKRNPFKKELMKMYIKRKVKESTKKKRNKKEFG